MTRPAKATEARRAETGTGSVHEGAVPSGIRPEKPSVFTTKEREMSDWQPISTAPRDGGFVLAYAPRAKPNVTLAFRDTTWGEEEAQWVVIEADGMTSFVSPTHWQPLPAPPTPQQHNTSTGDAG